MKPGAVTVQEQRAVESYWTPQRMGAAGRGEVPPPITEMPPPGVLFPNTGHAWARNGAVNRTVGRLFFTAPDTAPGAGDGSCTATVVDSPSGSTVVTAAHCLSSFLEEDKPNVWHTNVYFVPGYLDGTKPVGGFTVRASVTTDGYFTQHRSTEDFAMLVMNKAPTGRPIAKVTGSQRIAFNTKRETGQPAYAFGYSAAMWNGKPWDMGQLLGYSSGKAQSFNDQDFKGQWGVRSDQSGGSSGGPHLAGFNPATATGTVVGVTSQGGYLPDDLDYKNRYSVAANLDTTAQTLYNRAQQIHP